MLNMSFGRQGRVVVVMHTANAASAAEWSASLEMVASTVGEVRRAPLAVTSLVFTDGAAPSAEQRRSFVDRVGTVRFQTSVITASRLTRGIVTALSWFTPGVRAWDPDDVNAIVQHAGMGSHDLSVTMTLAAQLAAAVGGFSVYDRFAAGLAKRDVSWSEHEEHRAPTTRSTGDGGRLAVSADAGRR